MLCNRVVPSPVNYRYLFLVKGGDLGMKGEDLAQWERDGGSIELLVISVCVATLQHFVAAMGSEIVRRKIVASLERFA